jgi:hypothetical protein
VTLQHPDDGNGNEPVRIGEVLAPMLDRIADGCPDVRLRRKLRLVAAICSVDLVRALHDRARAVAAARRAT